VDTDEVAMMEKQLCDRLATLLAERERLAQLKASSDGYQGPLARIILDLDGAINSLRQLVARVSLEVEHDG
jgi:hypothetical protein